MFTKFAIQQTTDYEVKNAKKGKIKKNTKNTIKMAEFAENCFKNKISLKKYCHFSHSKL